MEQQASTPERFCPQCGKSREPLPIPHLSAECGECGRTVHFVRPGDNGEGIKIEAGERFTIPAGFVTLSLEPKPNSKMFRHGLPFLINQLFVSRTPTEADIVEFVNWLEQDFDKYVASTSAADGVDLTTEAGVTELSKRLEQDKLSRDWYIFAAAMCCSGVKWSVENGNAQRAAWAGYMLGTLRGLSIVSEPVFEETLWRGYLANEIVYEAAAAAGNRSPAEIEALKRLQPLFRQFDEATLHALVEGAVPIGPKIGVKNLPEELLRALAKHQLATLQRERDEAKQAKKDQLDEERQLRKERREEKEMKIKWLTAGAALASGGIAAVGLVLKFFGG